MKKVFTGLTLMFFSISLFSQEASTKGNLKNLRFGGTILPALSWYKPDNLKKFESNGAVAKFGVLINGEYSFSGNFALGFGIGLGSSGGKMTFTDTALYFFSDDEIISTKDTNGLNGKYDTYVLNNRIYNASYFLIPISIKMRTNEIGYMRYFFQPSFNINIRKKIRTDDDLVRYNTKINVEQTDLDITKDMGLVRFSTTLSAGGEYYLSGSTAFVFAIGFDYGLSNVVQKNSEYLIRNDGKAVEQQFIQHGVILTLGVLF